MGNKEKRAAFFRVKKQTPDFIETEEFRMCARKQKYETERVALKAIEEMQQYEKAPKRTYKCKYCKKWHLTHKE